MRWRALTVGLLAVCVAVPAWMLFRDRDNPPWHPTELAQARQDAHRVLASITFTSSCVGGCSTTVVDNTGPNTWRIELRLGSAQRCYVVRLDTLTLSGLSGLRFVPCTG